LGSSIGLTIRCLLNSRSKWCLELHKCYIASHSIMASRIRTTAGNVVLIFWLFITSISVLIGGELNAEIERQAEHRR
jgi:hypothetical protein